MDDVCPTCSNPSSKIFCATKDKMHRHFFDEKIMRNHLEQNWVISKGFCQQPNQSFEWLGYDC